MRNEFDITKKDVLYGIDKLVESYISVIKTDLPYYDSVNGIAEKIDGKPMIFGLNTDAKHLQPNDNATAQMFFYEHDSRKAIGRNFETELSCVVWFNQVRLEGYGTRIRERLIHELMNVFRGENLVEMQYFDTFQIFTERNQVFTDFEVNEKILKSPFDGFRIRFKTKYLNEC